ncbi:patellin-1-like isoform X2 [Telopea speciosissima]|uniref:patellin-1-like isoform X2 n=1 Tax=Telopea speciosissima TaxID=54955 RepID=UPI001CC44D50|nr:patellin-1-like isoform X2 [Telopea speciosissima]
MAEETQTKAEEVVVAETEKTAIEKETAPPAPVAEVPEVEEPIKPAVVEEEAAAVTATTEEAEKSEATEVESIDQAVTFQEESNVVSDLPDPEKKALEELKQLIQEALNKSEFTAPPPPPPAAKEEVKPAEEEKKAETEEAPAPAEKKPDTTEEATAEASAPAATEEPPKPEASDVAEPAPVEEVKEEKKEEPTPPAVVVETVEEVAAPPAVVVEEVVETVTSVDDDGAKTVEAIEETIVAVSAPAAPAEEPAPAIPEKEAEGESTSAAPAETKEEEIADAAAPSPLIPEEVSIWGVPLLADERSDAILLKFLRARDFKVKDAFAMIKSTVAWRKEFGIETLLEEDLGNDLEKAVFMYGSDKEGHPVCYNVYGEFQNKELYQKAFSDEEKRQKFLRWRIQFLEKSIRKLDFSPDGICTMVQVNDLKNSPGLAKRELRLATRQALLLLQDNYPEFVAIQVFINVPWWYLAFNRMISPFLTQRTKSKFVFAGPSKSAETLFKSVKTTAFSGFH